jgi:hypothetical protein
MPRVRFETTIPVFEREKTVHALDRAATEIGWEINRLSKSDYKDCFIFEALHVQMFDGNNMGQPSKWSSGDSSLK